MQSLENPKQESLLSLCTLQIMTPNPFLLMLAEDYLVLNVLGLASKYSLKSHLPCSWQQEFPFPSAC